MSPQIQGPVDRCARHCAAVAVPLPAAVAAGDAVFASQLRCGDGLHRQADAAVAAKGDEHSVSLTRGTAVRRESLKFTS